MSPGLCEWLLANRAVEILGDHAQQRSQVAYDPGQRAFLLLCDAGPFLLMRESEYRANGYHNHLADLRLTALKARLDREAA